MQLQVCRLAEATVTNSLIAGGHVARMHFLWSGQMSTDRTATHDSSRDVANVCNDIPVVKREL